MKDYYAILEVIMKKLVIFFIIILFNFNANATGNSIQNLYKMCKPLQV